MLVGEYPPCVRSGSRQRLVMTFGGINLYQYYGQHKKRFLFYFLITSLPFAYTVYHDKSQVLALNWLKSFQIQSSQSHLINIKIKEWHLSQIIPCAPKTAEQVGREVASDIVILIHFFFELLIYSMFEYHLELQVYYLVLFITELTSGISKKLICLSWCLIISS